MKKILLLLCIITTIQSQSVNAPPDLGPKNPYNPEFSRREQEILLPERDPQLIPISLLLENGYQSSLSSPEVLQLALLIAYQRSIIIVSGSILNKFLLLSKQDTSQFEKFAEEVQQLENISERASVEFLPNRKQLQVSREEQKRIEYVKNLKVEKTGVLKEIEKKIESIGAQIFDKERAARDTSDISRKNELLKDQTILNNERNNLNKELEEKIQYYDHKIREGSIKKPLDVSTSDRLVALYGSYLEDWKDTLNKQMALFINKHVQIDFNIWDIYKHSGADIYVFIPKNLDSLYKKNMATPPIRGRFEIPSEPSEKKGLHELIEEEAHYSGVRKSKLNLLDNFESLETELEKVWGGWQQYFFGRFMKSSSLNVQALLEMIHPTSKKTAQNVFYCIGNGDSNGNLISGLPNEALQGLLKKIKDRARFVYCVTSGGLQPKLTLLNEYLESSSAQMLLGLGYIPNPDVFTHIALEASVLLKRLPSLSFNRFFKGIEEAFIEKKNIRFNIGSAVNNITPIVGADRVVFEGMPAPLLWNGREKTFEPLLGKDVLEINKTVVKHQYDIDLSNKTMVIFSTSNIPDRLFSTKNIPLFVNTTDPKDKVIVIDEVRVPTTLQNFLHRSIFSTKDPFEKVWRIKKFVGDGNEIYDLTITKEFSPYTTKGNVTYKTYDNMGWRYFAGIWDHETSNLKDIEVNDEQSSLWRKDAQNLKNIYQTWADSLTWKNTWERIEKEGGAPVHVKSLIRDVEEKVIQRTKNNDDDSQEVFLDAQSVELKKEEQDEEKKKKVPPPPPPKPDRLKKRVQDS